jgi:predicted metal-dependent hydrolase
MSASAIQEFVEKHVEWVEKKQAEVASIVPEKKRQYQAGERFLFLGQEYPLEIIHSTQKKLVLEGCFKLTESAQKDAETLFRNWYRKQAGKIISERVAFFAERYQLPVETIRITSARTRWGSCSPKNKLSFSWRLVMMPMDVIDYVVVHELAHTVHHNHSRRFWNLVEKWMPDYKERRKQLRQMGKDVV